MGLLYKLLSSWHLFDRCVQTPPVGETGSRHLAKMASAIRAVALLHDEASVRCSDRDLIMVWKVRYGLEHEIAAECHPCMLTDP